ncbi:hypothetical protein STEG23_014878, partial [Scotinomys teguina]
MTVMPLGRDQDCSLKIREPDVPAPWFLDPGDWSKAAVVSLYFIFPGFCTLSLFFVQIRERVETVSLSMHGGQKTTCGSQFYPLQHCEAQVQVRSERQQQTCMLYWSGGSSAVE